MQPSKRLRTVRATIRKDLRLIDRMFGSFKGGSFRREHTDRAF